MPNPKKAVFHYRASTTKFIEPLRNGEPVGIKKLFYILRPLLACRWIIAFQTMPPTEFSRLLEETDVPPEMAELIGSFLKRKETAGEKETLNVPKHFADWILALDTEAEQTAPTLPASTQPGWEPLNQLFLDTLKEYCAGEKK